MYIIIDNDADPTNLSSSTSVRVFQWKRRQIDNYLIDAEVIAELLKDETVTAHPVGDEGEVFKLLKSIAFEQLTALAARAAYAEYNFRNASLQKSDVAGGDLTEIALNLFNRMASARASLPDADESVWLAKFSDDTARNRSELELRWEGRWRDLCDGKALISALHKSAKTRMSEAAFRARIVRKMREVQSENWRLMKSELEDLMKGPSASAA